MKKISLPLAAFALSALSLVPAAFAEDVGVAIEASKWRVVTMVDLSWRSYSRMGLDSFPVNGDFDKCREVATKYAEALPLPGDASKKFFCLDTDTGTLSPIVVQ